MLSVLDITSYILLEDHVLGLINVCKQLPPLKLFEIGAISFSESIIDIVTD